MDLAAMKQSFQCDALSRFKMRLGTRTSEGKGVRPVYQISQRGDSSRGVSRELIGRVLMNACDEDR